MSELALGYRDLAEAWLRERVVKDCDAVVAEMVLYSIKDVGKLVRSQLSLMVADMLGLSSPLLRDWCVAMELVHVSSLIHDDLPALDNDDYRRGQLTSHKVFGEGRAVLVGDYLCGLAFGILARSELSSSAVVREQLILLSDAYRDICVGQVLDITQENQFSGVNSDSAISDSLTAVCPKVVSLELLKSLLLKHRAKTGSLFRAAVIAPFVASGQRSESAHRALKGFALDLGLLFQITDDLLPARSSFEVSGKELRADVANGRVTFLSCYGYDVSERLARSALKRAERFLRPWASTSEEILSYCHRIYSRVA